MLASSSSIGTGYASECGAVEVVENAVSNE